MYSVPWLWTDGQTDGQTENYFLEAPITTWTIKRFHFQNLSLLILPMYCNSLERLYWLSEAVNENLCLIDVEKVVGWNPLTQRGKDYCSHQPGTQSRHARSATSIPCFESKVV